MPRILRARRRAKTVLRMLNGRRNDATSVARCVASSSPDYAQFIPNATEIDALKANEMH